MTEEPRGLGPICLELAGGIVAAYVSNNPVPVAELPALIADVHTAVAGLASGQAASGVEVEKRTPAEIRRSIRPEGITSFIDGKIYKTLKRHLTTHGLDPASYRARYGLPGNYPMVASAYSEKRSALAKNLGLGLAGTRAKEAGKARAKIV